MDFIRFKEEDLVEEIYIIKYIKSRLLKIKQDYLKFGNNTHIKIKGSIREQMFVINLEKRKWKNLEKLK